MHAITDPTAAVRAAALERLGDLETALTAHGFAVEVEVKFWALTAVSRAEKLSPARSQRVQLALDPQGGLNWYWAPSARDDIELLGPASAVDKTVELIASALHKAGRQ